VSDTPTTYWLVITEVPEDNRIYDAGTGYALHATEASAKASAKAENESGWATARVLGPLHLNG
jgi:hypothetical protein